MFTDNTTTPHTLTRLGLFQNWCSNGKKKRAFAPVKNVEKKPHCVHFERKEATLFKRLVSRYDENTRMIVFFMRKGPEDTSPDGSGPTWLMRERN